MRLKWAISAASTLGDSVMKCRAPVVQDVDRGFDLRPPDVVDEDTLTDSSWQRHALQAVAVLDAIEERLPHQRGVEEIERGHDAKIIDQIENPIAGGRGQEPTSARDDRGDQDVQQHGFAMQQAIFEAGFQPIAEAVAEIDLARQVV